MPLLEHLTIRLKRDTFVIWHMDAVNARRLRDEIIAAVDATLLRYLGKVEVVGPNGAGNSLAGINPTQGSIILYLQHRLQRPVPFCKFGLQRVVVVRPVYRDQKHPPVFKWKEKEICYFMGQHDVTEVVINLDIRAGNAHDQLHLHQQPLQDLRVRHPLPRHGICSPQFGFLNHDNCIYPAVNLCNFFAEFAELHTSRQSGQI